MLLISTQNSKPDNLDELSDDIESLISRYDKLKLVGTTEGLGNIASQVITGIIDFIIGSISNIKTMIFKMFADVRRSELEAYLQRHMVHYHKVKQTGYTEIYKTRTMFYPFKTPPVEMATFFVDTFKLLDIKTKFWSIISEYKLVAANLRIGDTAKANIHLNLINTLNATKITDSFMAKLLKTVVTQHSRNHTTFGEIFQSVKEFTAAISITLTCKDELNTAIAISTELDNLYKAYESITEALTTHIDHGIDISKLRGLSTTIRDTGHLLERYGVLIKEYTTIDHFLVTVLDSL